MSDQGAAPVRVVKIGIKEGEETTLTIGKSEAVRRTIREYDLLARTYSSGSYPILDWGPEIGCPAPADDEWKPSPRDAMYWSPDEEDDTDG